MHALRHFRFLPLFLLAACAGISYERGVPVEKDKEAQIVAGITTHGDILNIIGSPSATSFDGKRLWLYISLRETVRIFRHPKQSHARTVAIHFDANGHVERVAHLTQKDRRAVKIVAAETQTPSRPPGFWTRFLGNIGVVRPAGLPTE